MPLQRQNKQQWREDFLGGPLVKDMHANTGNRGSIPGLGSSHMLRDI